MKILFVSNASTDPSDAQIDIKFLIINCKTIFRIILNKVI